MRGGDGALFYSLLFIFVFTGKDYTVKEGDGAFYGPKIDITIVDSLRRRHLNPRLNPKP